MQNKFLLTLGKILEFILVYLVYLILKILPINFVSKLGGLIFRTIGPLSKTQKIVEKNLIQIFPENSINEIRKKSRIGWYNTGKTFFELFKLNKIVQSKKITIEGEKNIKKLLENNEKVIFVGIHQSNWEILLPSLDKLGFSVGGIYRHINNPYIDKLILGIRNKSILYSNSFYTPKGKQSAKDILEAIKKDISIVLLVDQKDSAGEIVNFFGYPSKTQVGFIKIARKYNMKIIPVQNIRGVNNTFTLKFNEPLKIKSNNFSDIEVMNTLNNIIEEWIKKDPTSWFLQHNRFS